ncbi:hypothetical protein [Acidovorax sp.]|uniref:hypothetical protein n=1 Tax=Acidovorax sp. TaxID=1872122 RepID=UPI0040378D49
MADTKSINSTEFPFLPGRSDAMHVPRWDVRDLSAGGDTVRGGARSVEINGTATALRLVGVDPGPGFKGAPEHSPVVVTGIDGQKWGVTGDGFFCTARRNRTQEEKARYYAEQNSRCLRSELNARAARVQTAPQRPLVTPRFRVLYLVSGSERKSAWLHSPERAQMGLRMMQTKYGQRNAIIYVD